VPLPKDEVDEEKHIFSRDEWSRFYEMMHDYCKPMMAFMLVTGCRIGEAKVVQVGDINFQAKTVAIVRAWKKGRFTTGIGCTEVSPATQIRHDPRLSRCYSETARRNRLAPRRPQC